MSKFGGSVHVSTGSDPLRPEINATLEQYHDMGFKPLDNLTPATVLSGIGGAFMPEELPLIERIPGSTRATREYLGREVQPELQRRAAENDPQALALAHQVGRLASAANMTGLYKIPKDVPFNMLGGTMFADVMIISYELPKRQVLDYGMGVAGLFMHLQNLKRGDYRVIGVQKSEADVSVLNGVIEHRGLQRKAQIIGGGIVSSTNALRKVYGSEVAGMAIASRVHSAGEDLLNAIGTTTELLCINGLFVARGPRYHRQGTGYEQVLAAIEDEAQLKVEVNKTFSRAAPNGTQEPNRLIVARKVA